jgi:hypothetical protein
MGIGIDSHDVEIPLVTLGITIYWESTKPSPDKTEQYTNIILTNDEPWIPSTEELSKDGIDDNASVFDNGVLFEITSSRNDHNEYESDYILEGTFGITEQQFYQRVVSKVQID